MSVTSKQIEFLARAIVNRLEDRGLAEFTDAESGIALVARVLAENFNTADSIEAQARERAPSARPDDLDVEVRRLAAKRNFIL